MRHHIHTPGELEAMTPLVRAIVRDLQAAAAALLFVQVLCRSSVYLVGRMSEGDLLPYWCMQAVPDDHGAIFRRGYAYASQGMHDRAMQDFNRAIEIQPNQGFYYYGRAQSLASAMAARAARRPVKTQSAMASPLT